MSVPGEPTTAVLSGDRSCDGSLFAEVNVSDDGLENGHLMLDFRRVQYLTSMDLAGLVTLQKRVRGHGGQLTLLNVNADVYDVFEAARLDTYFVIRR